MQALPTCEQHLLTPCRTGFALLPSASDTHRSCYLWEGFDTFPVRQDRPCSEPGLELFPSVIRCSGLNDQREAASLLYDTHTPMNFLQKGAVAVLSAAEAYRK